MFFIEYTEHETRKAINLALCSSIEVFKGQTDPQKNFLRIEFHGGSRNPNVQTTTVTIPFKTERQVDMAFDDLMNTIGNPQERYWEAPYFEDV